MILDILKSIVPIIKNVDLLYHESYFFARFKEMADYTGTTTALEAAKIARKPKLKN